MTYDEAILKAKKGFMIKLPNLAGYFKWNYGSNCLKHFINSEIIEANLDKNRTDYYFVI